MNKNIVRGMLIITALVPTVAACSGGGGSYCDAIKTADKELNGLKNLSSGDKAAMQKVVDQFKKIESAAPSDIKGDWQTVTKVMEAGASGDLTKLQSIDMTQFNKATDNIEKNVKDKCNITLGTSSK